MSETEKCVQLLCWALPGMLAGWIWGLPVGLMTFGGQMLAAPALVRLYIQNFSGRPELTLFDLRHLLWITHVLCGAVIAFMAQWAHGKGYIF